MGSGIDRIKSLAIAKEQLVLSLHIRGICETSDPLPSRLVFISLGPWNNIPHLDDIDRRRAAWGLERISTQNLAIALDSALKESFPDGMDSEIEELRSYFRFVRCLRNAFAHDPYSPVWVLTGPYYARVYSLPEGWQVDLTQRHNIPVQDSDYRHASGLIRLLDFGKKMIELKKQGA